MSSTRLHYKTRLHLLTWAPLCLRGGADWSLYVHILFDQKFTPDVIRKSGVKAKHFKTSTMGCYTVVLSWTTLSLRSFHFDFWDLVAFIEGEEDCRLC